MATQDQSPSTHDRRVLPTRRVYQTPTLHPRRRLAQADRRNPDPIVYPTPTTTGGYGSGPSGLYGPARLAYSTAVRRITDTLTDMAYALTGYPTAPDLYASLADNACETLYEHIMEPDPSDQFDEPMSGDSGSYALPVSPMHIATPVPTTYIATPALVPTDPQVDILALVAKLCVLSPTDRRLHANVLEHVAQTLRLGTTTTDEG